jgi:hypothetical protein
MFAELQKHALELSHMLSRDEGESTDQDVSSTFGSNVWGWSVHKAVPVQEVKSTNPQDSQAICQQKSPEISGYDKTNPQMDLQLGPDAQPTGAEHTKAQVRLHSQDCVVSSFSCPLLHTLYFSPHTARVLCVVIFVRMEIIP